MTAEAAVAHAHNERKASLNSLKEILAIPSISTLPEHQQDMQRSAEWFADQLRQLEFTDVEILPTAKHPVVYGQRMTAGANAPTVLVYGHYDVQPSDPDDLWESPAFEPTERGENLYARGASDMKGQLVAQIESIRAILAHDSYPVNLRYMIEGEEEIGSPSILEFVRKHRDKLEADLCLNLDAAILGADQPSITYALRGLTYVEIRLRGTESDLHSGRFGGAVDNPAQVLARLLAGMKDQEGRILLPGFYDNVRPLTDDERQDLAKLPQDEGWWKERAGANHLFGEPGFTPTERATARPTLDVNGLLSGFIGEGSKTVLPAEAMAKVSCRLVPDQDPAAISEAFREYLEANVPPTMTWELEHHAHSSPGIMDRDSVAVTAASAAFEQVWGKSPLFNREGGTVPIVGHLKDELEMPSLLLGFGLPDDNLHAPNEKIHLPTFYRGIDTHIHFAYNLANG